MKRIEKEWREYVTRCYDGEMMTDEQHQILRRSFYAGAIIILRIFQNDIGSVSEDEGIKIVRELYDELYEVKEEIRKLVEEEEKN